MAIVDLSIPLTDNLQLLPNLPKVSITQHFSHSSSVSNYEPPCRGCQVNFFSMPDHTGTHIDAPLHFVPGGKDISQIPVDSLIGEAVLIDAAAKGADRPLTLELFQQYISVQNETIREGDIVVIRCSTKRWDDAGYHQVQSLTSEVADYLVAKKVRAVGVDTLSVDCLNDRRRPVHLKLLGAEIILIEGLMNLELIGCQRFHLIALPLMLVSAGGSPTRAIAVTKQ
jgi:arylformamidase